jgi:dTDP-glucose 4,6-dehydratase
MKLVVTGGRGFIGSHFVEEALALGHEIIDIDKMTYAASVNLPWDNHKNYTLIKKDICEITHLPVCDVIVNFAAESHVDNSITSDKVFLESNVIGVYNILNLLRGKVYERPLFVHVSTDEVYGDHETKTFTEEDRLNPSNPYSSTKAAAEMLVLANARTYGIDFLISRSSNNYGERQYEEKLIPRCIYSIKNNVKMPVHGDGSYIRDWIYVKDNVNGILRMIESGVRNEIFNISSNNKMTNIDVIKTVFSWYNKEMNENTVKYVENRLGQDVRYSIDNSKALNMLNWKPLHNNGLYKFVK